MLDKRSLLEIHQQSMHCIQAATIFQLLEELHSFGCSVLKKKRASSRMKLKDVLETFFY
jgi:hypothetical protein